MQTNLIEIIIKKNHLNSLCNFLVVGQFWWSSQIYSKQTNMDGLFPKKNVTEKSNFEVQSNNLKMNHLAWACHGTRGVDII